MVIAGHAWVLTERDTGAIVTLWEPSGATKRRQPAATLPENPNPLKGDLAFYGYRQVGAQPRIAGRPDMTSTWTVMPEGVTFLQLLAVWFNGETSRKWQCERPGPVDGVY